jgi:pyruvate/2-oxoglutarate dehydrogenase complex dihydrolipoamide acyltransferase (E2) component
MYLRVWEVTQRMKNHGDYQITPFPLGRQLIVDAGRLALRKHTVRCLVEVDVTPVRQFIHVHQAKTGETLSFTAFLIACVGKAVGEDKAMHAYRRGRKQLILFDEVDVLTYVETELEGQKFPVAHIIRAANRKSWQAIHQEIRAVQAHPERSPKAQQWKLAQWFLLLPAFVRDMFYRAVNGNPHAWKKQVGTVYLTAVGMFGSGSGWGLAYSAHTLGVILGGIEAKPLVVAGQIAIRECLSLTLDFDHDVIDGAPAARFTERLKELIEQDFEQVVVAGAVETTFVT